MSVATNLIRVTRPISLPSGFTVVAYYHRKSAVGSPNGRLYAYEYDQDGELVDSPMQIDLPTTGDFGDFDFSESTMKRGDTIYDGSPALLIEESVLGGVWIWRPKSGSLDGHIWYNTSPNESKHVYAGGSIYAVRNSDGLGELLKFNLDLTLDSIVSQHTGSVSMAHVFCSNRSLCCGSATSSSFVRFPFDGSAPHAVSVSPTSPPTQIGSPYGASQSLVPEGGDDRFPRLINDDSPGVSYLWPDQSPWLRLAPFLLTTRAHYANGYIVASEENRIVIGSEDADVDDTPVLDLMVPSQNIDALVIDPFLVAAGNIP